MTRLRVAVLFGGRSGEHEISLASAESVMANLDPSRYEVVPIGITRDGRWFAGGDPLRSLKNCELTPANALALVPGASPGALIATMAGETRTTAPAALEVDVVFPVLHGPFGEDGTIQGMLDLLGLPYVGSGVLASAVSMDKIAMKTLWRAHGLPQTAFELIRRPDWDAQPDSVLDRIESRIGLPCFVKPANLGSSVGVHKARARGELFAALSDAARYDARVVVERAVDARELECSVLGNEAPRASVVGEVVPIHEFYDYRAKYLDEGSRLIIPADIPDEAANEVRRLAVDAFKAVGASGMSRVDFFLERESARVLLNEINTIPGFTRISMYPKLWEASGLSYRALLDELIGLAFERHADRARNLTEYRPEVF